MILRTATLQLFICNEYKAKYVKRIALLNMLNNPKGFGIILDIFLELI